MLQSSTLDFLKKLRKNNNKEWFDSHRNLYEDAKQDYRQFVESIIGKVTVMDESVGVLAVKDCIFRINRDVRFSKNKEPYKTAMGAYMARGGRKSIYAGYYFHLEPGSSMVAGGLWMPMPAELQKVRQEIDYNFGEFKKIITSKKFVSAFGELDPAENQSLSRPPKGYEQDNPAIEYIKMKHFTVMKSLTDEEVLNKNLLKTVLSTMETLKPFNAFLNRALE